MLFKICLVLLPLSLYAQPGYFEPWGKDAHLAHPITSCPKHPLNFAITCAEKVIRFHQNVLSPVDGPRSHFRPSSSRYMLDAIHKYGFFKGYIMGCDRLLRENDDVWCYKTIISGGAIFKYNPVP